jgi:AraC-like DNA-binding protein
VDNFRFELNPRGADLPHCNSVLNGRVQARRYGVDRYRTTLCLKSVARGSAVYRTPAGRYLVDPDCFLLLNDGQEYSLDIEAGSDTETLCPFFQLGFLGQVARGRVGALGVLLDDPFVSRGDPGFYERLYPKEASSVGCRLGRLLGLLHEGIPCDVWLEEFFYDLAGELLALRDDVQREVAAFPGRRPATRAELYRRLHRARDYIDSCYVQKLSVEGIARVSHLSPYHFHRAFRQAFGVTPMRHLQSRRLRAAARLLASTDRPVTAVALDVGFESLGSFSWLFRRHFGLSPRAYRDAERKPQA